MNNRRCRIRLSWPSRNNAARATLPRHGLMSTWKLTRAGTLPTIVDSRLLPEHKRGRLHIGPVVRAAPDRGGHRQRAGTRERWQGDQDTAGSVGAAGLRPAGGRSVAVRLLDTTLSFVTDVTDVTGFAITAVCARARRELITISVYIGLHRLQNRKEPPTAALTAGPPSPTGRRQRRAQRFCWVGAAE